MEKIEYISDGKGVLYKNEKREGKQPHYEGPFTIMDGNKERKVRIKMWIADPDKEYKFSVVASHKDEPAEEEAPF